MTKIEIVCNMPVNDKKKMIEYEKSLLNIINETNKNLSKVKTEKKNNNSDYEEPNDGNNYDTYLF